MDPYIVSDQKKKKISEIFLVTGDISLLLYFLFFSWPMYFITLLQGIWSPTLRDMHSTCKMIPMIQFAPPAENWSRKNISFVGKYHSFADMRENFNLLFSRRASPSVTVAETSTPQVMVISFSVSVRCKLSVSRVFATSCLSREKRGNSSALALQVTNYEGLPFAFWPII